jgi:hypothetical protein
MTDHLPQAATVPFRLGRPEELPGVLTEVAAAGAVTRPATLLLDDAAWADCETLEDAARAARAALAADPGPLVRDDPQESAANRDNDLAFGIERHGGAALSLMVDAGLAALIGLLELTRRRGVGLTEVDWADLFAGFATVIGWPADPGTPPDRPAPALPNPRGTARPDDALRCWVCGHHVFMVFAQCGAMALRCLRSAVEAGDTAGARRAAEAATTMMRASRGALRFAGDSSNDEYVAEIRPTLMPPVAPPKMSGLHWRDHEALIDALAGAGDAWPALADARLVAGFRDALDATYLAHRGVCEQFVGDSSPSLLARPGSSRSAVGVLAQFREQRLGLVPSSDERQG